MLNSPEFMPYVVFIASPSVDELTQRQNEAPSNARKLTVRQPFVCNAAITDLKLKLDYTRVHFFDYLRYTS